MTSDSALPEAISAFTPATEEVKVIQVRFKSEADRLLLILPTEAEMPASANNWSEIWQQMKQRLNAGDRFWQPHTQVE